MNKLLTWISITVIVAVTSYEVLGQSGSSENALGKHPRIGSGMFGRSPSGTIMMRIPSPQEQAARKALFAESDRLETQANKDYLARDFNSAEQDCLASLAAAPEINGRKAHLPLVEQMLGRVYLREGRNQEALTAFQSCYPNIADSGQNLDIAIAYTRLGNYEQAKKFYSDRAITRYRISEEPLKPDDLPGTGSLKSLEASALFARGLDEYLEHNQDDALGDLQAAAGLAPTNTPIAYWCAHVLIDKGRKAEAIPLLERVVASPRGHIFHEASRELFVARWDLKAATAGK